MNEIYPVEGKDLPDLPERWHWKRAGCAIATGFAGTVLAFGKSSSNVNFPVGAVRVLGVVLLLAAIAACVVTRFWTRYAPLGGAAKTLAWAAVIPGGLLLFIWYYILYVFWLIIVAVFSSL